MVQENFYGDILNQNYCRTLEEGKKKKKKDWSATLAVVPNAGSSERKLNDTMAARCNRKFTNKIMM